MTSARELNTLLRQARDGNGEARNVVRDALIDRGYDERRIATALAPSLPLASNRESSESINDLLGKTMVSVTQNGVETIDFEAVTGERWQMYHSSMCCELVEIEDVIGDLQDLVGAPIVMAEESTNITDADGRVAESFTWTFYRLATAKGYVTLRWFGSSNGYYSERVAFVRVNKEEV